MTQAYRYVEEFHHHSLEGADGEPQVVESTGQSSIVIEDGAPSLSGRESPEERGVSVSRSDSKPICCQKTDALTMGEILRRAALVVSPVASEMLRALSVKAEAMAVPIRCRHPLTDVAGGFVYVVHAPAVGLAKIGTTRYRLLLDRMIKLQSGSPVELHLVALAVGGRHLEHEWHREHKALRHHGEWFADSIVPLFADAMARSAPHGCARCALVGDQQ
jgi:hypothetical protein